MDQELSRREMIAAGLVGFGGLVLGAAALGAQVKSAGEEVLPTEDLMREHGVLRRLLLIYEAVGRRAAARKAPLPQLGAAARILQRFIEDYHEKLEENYVFPTFEKAGRLTDLTAVLRAQHQAGRVITVRLKMLALDKTVSPEVPVLIAQFLRMYRPHAAREDTVLFPQFAGVAGRKKYAQFGELFEGKEHQLFGAAGFEGIVAQVAGIEKQLGIYNLAQFTPRAGARAA